jgi:hypothetical protein
MRRCKKLHDLNPRARRSDWLYNLFYAPPSAVAIIRRRADSLNIRCQALCIAGFANVAGCPSFSRR